MKTYRCYNPACGGYPAYFEFEADAPVCPKCGADERTPGGRDVVTPLVVLHYDEPVRVGKGTNVRACDPARAIHSDPAGKFGGTGHAPSVTCARCKATEAYQKAMAAHEED